MSAPKVAAVIEDFCSGSHEEALAAERHLDRLLADDPAARAMLASQYRMHARLRAMHAPPRDCAAAVCRILKRRRRVRRALIVTVTMAAALLIAVGSLMALRPTRTPAAAAWGTVTAVRGPVHHDGQAAEAGRPVAASESLVVAAEASVVLLDAAGARLTLTESARATLRPDGLRLERGRLDAEVPPRPPGHPLIIATPHADYEVLGTRFTVRVTDDWSHLTVQAGRVRAREGDGTGMIVGSGASRRSGVAPLPPPVLYLDFEQRDGRDVVDRSGRGHRVWVTRVPEDATGVRGRGLACAIGRVLQVSDADDLTPDRGTFCLWLKPTIPLPEHEALVPAFPIELYTKADWDTRQGIEIGRPAHGPERWGLRVMLGDGATHQLYLPTERRTVWMHVAASWGDGHLRWYIDGELRGEVAATWDHLPDLANNARIGNNLVGVIDEVRLYAAALSAEQIRALYTDSAP